ncbi:glycosyltransferase [Sessilibacter corallicola]|uniref:glycosyltransferase n=1 Tax=Sessilibacter corallicola TaxID=2904075 RepID=UPI001E2A0FAB|nr:glycosyltransferase [Sessilibacter corallicola]MCE2028984.1 glycosyltransferase [Sessilibacter corallicola]
MKVLHLYRTFFPESQGGLEESIYQISSNTRHYGVEPRVLVPSNDGKCSFDHKTIPVQSFQRHGEIASCDWSFSALGELKANLEWADILHLHYPWPFADLLLFLSRSKIPTVLTYHSDIVRQKLLMKPYQPLQKWYLGRVDKIIATSQNYIDTSEVLPNYSDKTSVIPLGISEGNSNQQDVAIDKQSKFSTLPEKFVFFVGVLRYYKGLRYLLEAAQEQSFHIVIAGDGREKDELLSLKDSLQLTNVTFLGHISDEDKFQLMRLSSIVVLPSCERSEAFGMTLVEASMMSKPMITCELGTGTSFVNKHKVTGLVVEPKSASALSESINSLIHDDEKLTQFGQAARLRYEELFSGPALGREYAKVYESLLDGN